jgi:hypothetical protein
MRYAIARFNQHQRDLAYRIYVTDCLRMNLECVAQIGGGSVQLTRYADLIDPSPKDERTAEEIIDCIRSKL